MEEIKKLISFTNKIIFKNNIYLKNLDKNKPLKLDCNNIIISKLIKDEDLENNSITKEKIAKCAITSEKIANNILIRNLSVNSLQINFNIIIENNYIINENLEKNIILNSNNITDIYLNNKNLKMGELIHIFNNTNNIVLLNSNYILHNILFLPKNGDYKLNLQKKTLYKLIYLINNYYIII